MPFARKETANFGRWASGLGIAGKALAYAAVSYALDVRSKKQAMAVSEPEILDYLRKHYKLKFNAYELPWREYEGNFFPRKPGPKPMVYCWRLEDWKRILQDLPSSVKIML